MTRPQRFIRTAYQASTKAECTFLVGATIALGSRIISTGCCTQKTHPRNPKIKRNSLSTQTCAEVKAAFRAIRKLPPEKIKKCTIYVARSRRDGTMGMAKPCSHCMSFLREIGIRDIYYTTNSGKIERMEA